MHQVVTWRYSESLEPGGVTDLKWHSEGSARKTSVIVWVFTWIFSFFLCINPCLIRATLKMTIPSGSGYLKRSIPAVPAKVISQRKQS